MNFKDLFIVSDEEPNKPAQPNISKEKKTVSFPSNSHSANDNMSVPSMNPVFPTAAPISVEEPTVSVSNSGTNPFLEKIQEVYERGFEKLNQPGYDFFEFFRAVTKAGMSNPQVYVMAFDMAQGLEPSLTKELLINQADYYLSEFEKVWNEFSTNGKVKLKDLTQRKNTESNTLSQEISALQQQIIQMQTQISLKQSTLNDIDHKYQPEINEINLKLDASDTIKKRFETNINTVKKNIINNLK